MKQHYIIKEYDSFVRGKALACKGYINLSERTFDQLEQFILANRSVKETDALELMTLSSKRGIGKVISAKNYVGLITMTDGTEIEILPKIFSNNYCNEECTKRIFLEMLKTYKEVPYKVFNDARLKAERMNIFEVFIRMFINECFALAKKGIKSAYMTTSGNERFFKGKIVFVDHIANNYAHRERAFVEYDVFSVNRAENRLIKSTIKFLYQSSKNIRNKKDLSLLLAVFDDVDLSCDYNFDFSQYIKNRNISDYETIMSWCRVFLMNNSFTSFSGSDVAQALLFPMEQVFESYVATLIKRKLNSSQYTMKTQDRRYHLFNYPVNQFSLRPDIVVADKMNGLTTIMDTKWKLLSLNQKNYGISQADMYQMYAYYKKYAANQVILIYPIFDGVKSLESKICFRSEDGALIRVEFVDFDNMEVSINHILNNLNA